MWKILTALIREEIYYALTSCELFPEEHKGCHKEYRGTPELLYIDQHNRKEILDGKIDDKTPYYMVSQSWIINCLKMYTVSDEVINYIQKSMKTWRVDLTAGGRGLTDAKIQRGIFQEDALLPLLFIIAMMPLNHILRKCRAGYRFSRLQERSIT